MNGTAMIAVSVENRATTFRLWASSSSISLWTAGTIAAF
jgi:hypothetical protein